MLYDGQSFALEWVYLFVYLSMCLPICPSIYLSVYLSIYIHMFKSTRIGNSFLGLQASLGGQQRSGPVHTADWTARSPKASQSIAASWFQLPSLLRDYLDCLSLGALKQQSFGDCEITQFPCRWKQKSQQLRRQKTDDLTRFWSPKFGGGWHWNSLNNNIKHHRTAWMLYGAVSQLCGSILACDFWVSWYVPNRSISVAKGVLWHSVIEASVAGKIAQIFAARINTWSSLCLKMIGGDWWCYSESSNIIPGPRSLS